MVLVDAPRRFSGMPPRLVDPTLVIVICTRHAEAQSVAALPHESFETHLYQGVFWLRGWDSNPRQTD